MQHRLAQSLSARREYVIVGEVQQVQCSQCCCGCVDERSKKDFMSSSASSCSRLCSADGSRPHGSFQPVTISQRTTSRTLGTAPPWMLWLGVQLLCAVALVWCLLLHSSSHSCALPPVVTCHVELPDFQVIHSRVDSTQDPIAGTPVITVVESIVDVPTPQMPNNKTDQAIEDLVSKIDPNVIHWPAHDALSSSQVCWSREMPLTMMMVTPKSPNEELEKEKRATDTEFYKKEPHIKEAGQEDADLVKYYNDTADLYYYQDKEDMPLTSHRLVRDMRMQFLGDDVALVAYFVCVLLTMWACKFKVVQVLDTAVPQVTEKAQLVPWPILRQFLDEHTAQRIAEQSVDASVTRIVVQAAKETSLARMAKTQFGRVRNRTATGKRKRLPRHAHQVSVPASRQAHREQIADLARCSVKVVPHGKCCVEECAIGGLACQSIFDPFNSGGSEMSAHEQMERNFDLLFRQFESRNASPCHVGPQSDGSARCGACC
eukprot:1790309-Amphidinium_carterae.1